ncbi:hypothetical protein CAPTEDRAFT_189383 [Capitella teleta]|uniref:Proteasome activator complex subunit 4-like HEAT repeat-like domain-containing protein n=1 Tax=Capitella teleta TaxID=283909 RepID=R7UMB4_CAPTE|nr:hypothetical protein CAPTEDRAFT_189383 [Capitella teleta]|eukprot:ELU04407.1 hypothetical protein CAPTEDRAFT_189383 [Capitella teleta]
MRPLVDYMLAHQEDDTLSLKVICKVCMRKIDNHNHLSCVFKVYRTLLFNYGCAMNFEKGQISRLNEYLSGKKNMRIYRQGKKFYSPLILKEEITLRHQKRVFMKMSENFTRFHQDLFDDMFRLSYSHYSSIRKTAQQILGDGFCLYPATLDFFHERILSYLKDDPSVEHHQHKASLFFLVRMNPFGNRMKCGIWEYMKLTWSALVQSKHSEKPSILKLLESVQEGVRLQETPFLSLRCSPALIESGRAFWAKGSSVAVNAPTESELKQGETAEVQRIAKAKQDFLSLVETLLNLVEGGSLHWRFHHMALTMISSLIRSDIKLPAGAVEMFTRDLINDSVKIRKICLRSLGSILRQHKRKQVRVEIDPFKLGGTERPADLSTLVPGIRPDNQWMLYDGKSNPYESEEKWNSCVFVEHTYIGYHTWAKKVEVYAPTKDQPPLDRDFESLSESEQHVYKYFTDQKFVDQFIKFKALETQSKLKGRGSVTCRCFIVSWIN